jgi:hypothetical protein
MGFTTAFPEYSSGEEGTLLVGPELLNIFQQKGKTSVYATRDEATAKGEESDGQPATAVGSGSTR